MDSSASLPMLYAELNAAGREDLVFWTFDELVRYGYLELSKLTTGLMLFVDARNLSGIANQPAYDLAHTTDDQPKDTGFVSLIHAVWNGASLAPMNMREVEARDANWVTTTGTPSAWIGDWLTSGMLMLYPSPAAPGTLTVFCQRGDPPPAIGSIVPAPDALADLLHMRVLADARSKRSDAWMPEAAALADQIADVLEKAFTAYYGSAM
jgi:hypothetical protein